MRSQTNVSYYNLEKFIADLKNREIMDFAILEYPGGRIMPWGIDPEKACALAEAIQFAQPPLTLDLDLDINRIGDTGACALAQAITIAQIPITLSLAMNDISDIGACAFAQAIIAAQMPFTLNLKWNSNITNESARAFAEAIKVARIPVTLSLETTRIKDQGVCLLAEAIQVAHFPVTLDLTGNVITDVGACALAKAIKAAHTPVTLNLKANEISDIGKKAIADALQSNLCPLGTKIAGLGEDIEKLCKENDRFILERQAGLALSLVTLLKDSEPTGFSECADFTILALLLGPQNKTILTGNMASFFSGAAQAIDENNNFVHVPMGQS